VDEVVAQRRKAWSILRAMTEVGVHEAKTQLSRLLRKVVAGEHVLITRRGEPIARLVPVHTRKRGRLGMDRVAFEVPDDFDAPLSDEELDVGER
jgi:prevent-host-death family protein